MPLDPQDRTRAAHSIGAPGSALTRSALPRKRVRSVARIGRRRCSPTSVIGGWGDRTTLPFLSLVESRCGAVAVGRTYLLSASFVWRCLSGSTMTPFPHPAHRTLWGFPCFVRFPCVHAAATTPAQRLGVLLRSFTQPCQPSPKGSSGRPAHRPFRGLLGVHSRSACTLAPSPIRDALSEGFSHFVTSIAAPVASGWSGCRVGLAPTGKRRLVTAHTLSRHWSGLADELKLPAHSGIALTVEDEIIFRAVACNCTAGGRGKVLGKISRPLPACSIGTTRW